MENLEHVSKVFETNYLPTVNSYLDAGWNIIAIATGQDSESNEPAIKYSLGWLRVGDPVIPKPL